MSPRASSLLNALILGLVLITGCDPSVDIVNPNDQYRYSLFGILDVARDTQVIRVEPLGDTTQIGAPRSLDATVHLKNLDTGTEIAMHDSFDTIAGGTASVHNAWTTHDIQPETRYRVTVRENGEVVTSVATTTPTQGPAPRTTQPLLLPCGSDEDRNTIAVRFDHPNQVAAFEVIYPIYQSDDKIQPTRPSYDHLRPLPPSGELAISYGDDLRDLYTSQSIPEQGACLPRDRFTTDYVLLTTALGGPQWPEWLDASLNSLARPDSFSNVKGGHGFIGGVHTDTIRIPIRERS